ncbi:MAG: insulinase family protein [Bacteroidetes bacterium]|nr:insulinase family protein [Bacteroidota bacterium]MBV6461861.1 putative zinc protease [Flavobacteriales bacterium]WKZ74431.1 MAG: pitrilysin family protein [Vicingaceae bacterium]MCL4816158.1 insulinase family protein [Flavobacteriales bacterium]NOG95044.1 insulinase family protein [Bacteroidota bacterium]
MIAFNKHTLSNGLKVISHFDNTSPIVAVNLLYDVGARDESPEKTGFAHLFEHLMFGGSVNVPHFDEELQQAGGENNAFTSNDITNYYETLPLENIETALWLESDRMLSLAFTPKSLEVQRNVVVEEFKQRYLNQPYGDAWLLLRPLAYKVHPYRWATIGKEISHIENAAMQDVKDFFFTHYRPNNAILCVAGNIQPKKVFALAEKWFGSIPKGEIKTRHLLPEPTQTEARRLEVERDIPADAIYITFHMCNRTHPNYQAFDLLSDVLSRGESSRFFENLVKEKQLFSEISAYVSGDIDNGLFIINGRFSAGVKPEEGEKEIWNELQKIAENGIDANELTKVKNKVVSGILFLHVNVLNKAMTLAYSELLGNANLINTETDLYLTVTTQDIQQRAAEIFIPTKASTLVYHSKKA